MNWQGALKNGLKRFPVQVTLAAWLVYLVTLTHGVSLANLGLVAQLCGWDYQPLSNHPLWWLLTLPLRVLPAGVVPLAVNALAATCAALALGFLAATLERQAWDRPPAGLPAWGVRLPVILGVVACGGEFNFWQAATAETGEALPLLFLAAALWCLTNYRPGRQLIWLKSACLLWGLGMAENWAMILTLPLFAVAVFWLTLPRLIKKWPAWQLLILLLAGSALIFLPPIVNSWWPHSPYTPHEAWRAAGQAFKHGSVDICLGLWRGYLPMVFTVLVFYLLPGLPVLFRLPDLGTHQLIKFERTRVWLLRAFRAGLLLILLWLAFDPTLGPRQLLQKHAGLSLPLLSLDYLTGIGAGVLAANLLLVLYADEVYFKNRPLRTRTRFQSWPILSVRAFTGVLVIVVVGLLWRNVPAITLANRQPLAQFGADALAQLPNTGGIVLTDDAFHWASFVAAGATAPSGRPWLAVNTTLLPTPAYRRWLARQPGGTDLFTNYPAELTPIEMVSLVQQLARTNRIFYLHPSFGYFFEFFYLEPAGPASELKALPPGTFGPPPLTAEVIARNETFWNTAAPRLAVLGTAQPLESKKKNGRLAGVGHLFLEPVESTQSRLLGTIYAIGLNDWAVRLQRAGQLTAAHQRWDQALAVNRYNLAAQMNWQVNSNLLAGHLLTLENLPALVNQFGERDVNAHFLQNYGPVDEPAWCLVAGNCLRQSGLFRGASQQFERARELVPHSPDALWELAQTYVKLGLADQARTTLDQIRQSLPPALLKTNYTDARLTLLEAATWYGETNVSRARLALRTLTQEYPADTNVAPKILEVQLENRDWSSALENLTTAISRSPEAPDLLNLQGVVLVQAGQPAAALKVFDHLLTVTNLSAGRINHAVTQLVLGNYPAATREYREIQSAGGDMAAVKRGQTILANVTASHAPIPGLYNRLTSSPSGPVLVPIAEKPPANSP